MTSSGCHSSANNGVCQEYGYPTSGIWQDDPDCCACHDESRCDEGYQKAIGLTDGNCYTPAAGGSCQVQTTCCIPIVADVGREYVRSPSTVNNYAAAITHCGDNGLAIINSESEQVRAKQACGSNMCFIDLKDESQSGIWTLADGSLPLYTNWNVQYRQPDRGYGPEYYVILNAGDVDVFDGSWFDSPDGNHAHALCNIPPSPPPLPPLPSPPPPSLPSPSPPPPLTPPPDLTPIFIGAGGGGALLLLIVVVAVICCCMKRSKKQPPQAVTQDIQPQIQPQVQMAVPVAPTVAIPMGEPAQLAPKVPTKPAQPAVQDKVTKLKELKQLLDSGTLTQAEFDEQKQMVLADTVTL